VCHTDGVEIGQTSLFGAAVPEGLEYRAGFIDEDEEAALGRDIGAITFATYEMRGVTARRRVAFFGRTYDPTVTSTPELPAFLLPLRERIARWANLEPDAFAMALINEYSPGAPIGWHRDAPQYGIVGGVSLLSSCRMRFRPYVPPARRSAAEGRRVTTHEIELERRSAYLMTGKSRTAYEHHIPAVKTLRYSITFRTLRAPE